MHKGFTLLEVLISLIILSIIAVVSTNFLQSSVVLKNQADNKLEMIREFDLGSHLLRRDFLATVNAPMRDSFGNRVSSFIGSNSEQKLILQTNLKKIDFIENSIVRIEYAFEADSFVRKQYFSANPYFQSELIESTIFSNIDQVTFAFLNQGRWSDEWPLGAITSRKIPELVKITFQKKDYSFDLIVNPNIKHVYQN